MTPDPNQAELARTIISHWTKGFGSTYNVDRQTAMQLVHVVDSIETVIDEIGQIDKIRPVVVSTTASRIENSVSFDKLKKLINCGEKSYLILFGTAHGLSKELIRNSDYALEPIDGAQGYNHLSVRSAASIIIDRLIGQSEIY